MRVLKQMLVALALCSGCSNQAKKEGPRVETKDASSAVTLDGPRVGPLTDEQLRKLFQDAASCAPPCQALDELRELAKAYPAQVAAVALEAMADPSSKTDQGIGQMSMIFVEDWLKSGPDEAPRVRTAQALERVSATGSTYMRTKAYELLGQFRLPEAQRILVAEVENPARDARERDHAGSALGFVIDDFTLIRSWLGDDQPFHWQAALEMLSTFERSDPDARERRWDEQRALIVKLAKRPELPAAVVYDLAHWFDIYLKDKRDDAEVLALAKRWASHSDDMAAGQMRKVLLEYE
jgi:hypothetical protein